VHYSLSADIYWSSGGLLILRVI